MKIQGHNFTRRTKVEGSNVLQEITFSTNEINACDEFFSGNPPDTLSVEIKRKSKGRSLDANGYFWKLADELAKKLLSTKEEVYREMIHRVGVFYDTIVAKTEEKNVIRDWQRNGLGWIAEEQNYPSKEHAYLRLYKGSSVYDTKEMSRLIDELVSECRENGIETLTPDEKEELLQKWGAE